MSRTILLMKTFLFTLIILFHIQLNAQTKPTSQHPHTFYRLTLSDLNRLPIRGIESYLPIFPGIIEINGNLHFRASRANDIAYLLDGFNVTDAVNHSNGVSLIPEAIDQLEIHTGAFGSKYGRTTGGVVHSRMRTGGDEYEFGADIRSDDFANPGNQFFKTSSFGYRNVVMTAGGTLPIGIKFFVAGQHNFWRNRQPMFLENFRFDSLREDRWSINPGKPLPGPLEFQNNYLNNNWNENNTIQANLTSNYDNFHFQLIGSFTHDRTPQGSQWPLALDNYYRQKRNMLLTNFTSFVGMRTIHEILPSFYYKVSIAYFNKSSELTDPDFGNNWQLFTDSIAYAEKGYNGFRSRYAGPHSIYTLNSFIFNHPDTPNNKYEKSNSQSLQTSLEAVAKLTDSWELRSGIASEWWTLRKYSIQNISSLMQSLYGYYGNSPRVFKDGLERRIQMLRGGNIHQYGYNVDGKIVNSGYDAPRTPSFSSAYVENIFQGTGHTIHAGLRLERYDLQLPMIPDYPNTYYDPNYGWFDESRFTKSKPIHLFLPRISVVTKPHDRTDVYFSFGKYARYVPLEEVLISTKDLSQILIDGLRYYGLKGSVSGQFLQPEQTMHYEAGISHRFNKLVAADVRLYYKLLSKQAQLAWADSNVSYLRWLVLKNEGGGKASGLELTIHFTPESRFAAQLNYSLTDATGNYSDSRGNWKTLASGLYWEHPQQYPPNASYPFSYTPTHHGSLMLEFKFDERDGWLLDGLRLIQLSSFHSGKRYTRVDPVAYYAYGSYEPGVVTIIDPLLSVPSETPNASTTPWYYNFDLRIEKIFLKSPVRALLSLDILNLFNRRNVLNVYPTTGSPTDDGWLHSLPAQPFIANPEYEKAYRIFNLQNRWAYMNAAGFDIYGTPRQIRLGLRIEV
ncbi:MAG: TonB-dependent receptor plug domain-containing protein [Bacteroidota bacterium]|nr:TonB-dependent receptor plug domain-containing protein [Bacteroidota bacterium]